MRVRSMPADRFFGISARLLAGAAALTVAGPALVMWFVWGQSAQSFGPDGVATDLEVPVPDHIAMVMLDFNYRQVGTQLLFASAMVGVAVVLLHRWPSWEQVSRLRWEVLGVGLLVLVPVIGFALANVYLMTSPRTGEGTEMWFGPPQLVEQALGPLAVLIASLLVLLVAALGWLRLAPADSVGDGSSDDDPDIELDGIDDAGAREPADARHASAGRTPDGRDHTASRLVEDYRHDWSPEDFRPPS